MAHAEKLTDIIRRGESTKLEFKREIPSTDKKYLKTVVAFANGTGGHLLFGVEDGTCEVIGIPQDDIFRAMDALTDAVANACTPPIVPEIRIQTIEGKAVLDMEVLPGQNKPYYIRKEGLPDGVYVRAGATTRRAEHEQLQELILQGHHQSYDEQPSGGAPPDAETISKLCRDIEKRSGKPVSLENLVGWNVLLRQKKTLVPTNAFELLTRNNSHFAVVQCACFKGKTKGVFIDKADYEGPVQEQIEQAYQFILRNIRMGAHVEGLYRVERYEIPEGALREAVVNAVVHRNYLQHAYIQVAIYDDRVEIVSPGGLYGGLTLEQAENGTSSIRNRVLADVFAKMNLVEHWGTGLLKIKQMCREAAVAAPEFRDDVMTFTSVFYRCKGGSPVSGRRKKKKLSQKEQAVLNHLDENTSITNEMVRRLTGLTVSGARALFIRLEKDGYIKAEGDKKHRVYLKMP